MKRTYEVRDRADKRAIREFLKREGQFLLPMLELVEQTEVAIDEVIQVMGRATIEAVLEMSAEGVAGVKQAGRSRAEDDTVWYGRQGGVVYLLDRRVRVERPRLRRRGAGEGGEVEVPAYAAMRRPGAVADRMLEVLMAGVSTRKYGRVIGEMADTVGVSKSAVSRETVEASERVLKELMERRLDAWDLLVIYLDGIQMGSHHVLAAVGVDSDGKKHVLGVREAGRVKWRHVPFLFGLRHGDDGAKAAECAADQGQYWEMHDLLYTRHEEWTKPRNPKDFLHSYANELGLETTAFETCYRENHGKDRTRRATRAADDLDVSGTPTFFINGSRALGALTMEVFRGLLEEAERGATAGR